MDEGKAVFKKILFICGRVFTVLAVLTTAIYILWSTSQPIYHWLSRTPGLELFFFDDAIILPMGVSLAGVTAVSLMNILFFRKELPMHDHFLSLIQTPMLVFGSQIVLDCVAQSGYSRGSFWSTFVFGSKLMSAQVAVIVFFAILILFTVMAIRNTARYAKSPRGSLHIVHRRTENAPESAAA